MNKIKNMTQIHHSTLVDAGIQNWSVMYNACTLLVKLLFSHYLNKYENNRKTISKPGH